MKTQTKEKEFASWDDALAYANDLYASGDISRNEIDKIARAAFKGSKGMAEPAGYSKALSRLSDAQFKKLEALVNAEGSRRGKPHKSPGKMTEPNRLAASHE